MRLWTLHPRYLDRPGLTGGWREALLAQAVLAGRTRGYRSHPQLVRFRRHADTPAAVSAYLAALADEAERRGYRFDRSRIDRPLAAGGTASSGGADGADGTVGAVGAVGTDGTVATGGTPAVTPIPVTEGQVAYEWQHLLAKLAERSPEQYAAVREVTAPEVHPLFQVVPGPVEDWERPAAPPTAPRAGTR
ncbi:MAG: pyrimidine dimer DNA glycosylase/endonuclease V [Micrococcus sp.]|nr:pyrimidine dimer DNA glycosylase/endonuclease V [Micrococcus sp.]